MIALPVSGEPVVRHRGGGRDENGKLITATAATLSAIGVAPGAAGSGLGGGTERLTRARNGEDIECTVYFALGTDVVNSDELTVRGQRFRIIVNDWQGTPGGLEVLCTRGQG
jgi:hypothetical protein